MTVAELKDYFKKELSETYTMSEIHELFSVFSEKFLGFNKLALRNQAETQVQTEQINQFQKAVAELKTGKPFQQILGETEFFAMKFFVNEHVLIPRPETEELLELALQKLNDVTSILDIGTGSGIIPVILKKHFPAAEITALDISAEALKIATKNAAFHQTEINFVFMDFLKDKPAKIFDVIISNPPYIGQDEEGEIAASVKDFEPLKALFSPSDDALVFYRHIAEFAKTNLAERGKIFLEINQKLGQETLEIFTTFRHAELLRDISGNFRFIYAEK